MIEILSLLLVGVTAGTLAGLLGVGGGIIIVPSLVWIFHTQLPASSLMHIAIGTSLATMAITSISSIIAHHQRGAVLWSIVWQLSPGIIVGAFVGAIIADALPTEILRKIFAIFILLASAQLGLLPPAPHRQLPGSLSLAGTVIGQISALVGIGGGSLTVPFLVWFNIPIRNAVATSAACGFPIAVSGMIGFVVTGWHINTPWMIGYIYWPAFVAITPATLLFAPLGAKLAHTLPVSNLKKLFAIFLAGIGINMLIME